MMPSEGMVVGGSTRTLQVNKQFSLHYERRRQDLASRVYQEKARRKANFIQRCLDGGSTISLADPTLAHVSADGSYTGIPLTGVLFFFWLFVSFVTR